jgi:Ca2+-binding RTX toxin-like protein
MSGIISGEAQAISLYLVNQLRHAPQTWATMLNVDLYKDYTGATFSYDASPKDSLTYDALLQKTAGDYSVILAAMGNIDHHYPGIGPATEGKTDPGTRATAEGYTGTSVWENLAYKMVSNSSLSTLTDERKSYMLVEQLFIDDGFAGLGHRKNYLEANHSEVGFGFSTGPNLIYSAGTNVYTTENYGIDETAATTPHLTGFVLLNSDGNLQYNTGEGIVGVTITITDNTDPSKSTTVLSQDYGYWDVAAVAGHRYTVSASGGSFSGTATAADVVVDSGGTNGYNTRTIDFFSGDPAARVDYGVPANHAATGTVSISGQAVVGATLHADTSALTDAEGLGTFNYRWLVDGHEITDVFNNGSVSSSSGTLLLGEELAPNVVLALTQSASTPGRGDWLVGHTFSVVVTYTDQSGALEALKSAETAAVTDMTVAEALANLGNGDYQEISITDSGAHLINLANTLVNAADFSPYHKIREFHLSDEATVSVAEATSLYVAMYRVNTWNNNFGYWYWLGGGHLTVSDTIEHFSSATGNSSLALQLMSTTLEVTGGTVSVSALAGVLNNYSNLSLKSGATLTLDGTLSTLSSGDATKVLDFINDHTAPQFAGATIIDGSHSLLLTYDEALDTGSTPAAASFDVTVNAVHHTPVSVSVNGKTVQLTLADPVGVGDGVAVAYNLPGSGMIQDISGNDAGALQSTAVTVQAIPPSYQSAATTSGGNKVILTYDKALSLTTAQPGFFSVTVCDSGTESISLPHNVISVGVNGNRVELTLDTPINNGRDIVKVSYTDPSTGDDTNAIQGTTGSDAASFSNMAVTNDVTLAPAIFGTSGNETIIGGDGNDEIYAKTGSDSISGGPGNDILDAGYHADSSKNGQFIELATSSNTVSGGDGNDEIYGTNVNDLLSGDAGDDILYADSGNDTLIGGAGNDYLYGGDGADTAVFSQERWKYTVTWKYSATPSGSTYTVTDRSGADGVDTVVNVETFRFADGDVTVADILNGNVGNHAPTGSITITGEFRNGQTIGVVTDSLADVDGLPGTTTFTYQWKAGGMAISGATRSNFLLTSSEVGKVVTVTVGYTDLLGTTESFTSTGTPAVEDDAFSTFTLNGSVSFWKDGSRIITGVDYDLLVDSASVAHGTVGTDGLFTHDSIPQGTYALTVTKTTGASDTAVTRAINSSDALAALKIAVGINPNSDNSEVTPYQYLAADANKDHRITSTDALAILKMAVKLSTAPGFEWLLVPDSVGSLTMSRTSVNLPNGVTTSSSPLTLDHNQDVHLVGILLGDVNGSWT